MKAVLISIQPKWCELIARFKKLVEVRKTKPKLDVPFKCYIYCTKDKHGWFDFLKKERLDGKVIGEFVCDAIEHYTSNCTVFESVLLPSPSELEEMCLTLEKFNSYGERGKLLYGWHISNLVIYDKPKELSEFRKFISFLEGESIEELEECGLKNLRITRPPQSWCYVESLAG